MIDLRYSGGEFGQGGELICSLVFPRAGGGRIFRYRSVDGGEGGDGGVGERRLDRLGRVIVGSYGDVLPEPIVLFGKVYRDITKRYETESRRGKKGKERRASFGDFPVLVLDSQIVEFIGEKVTVGIGQQVFFFVGRRVYLVDVCVVVCSSTVSWVEDFLLSGR